MKWRRNTFWIISLTLMALAIGFGLRPQPVLVTTATVERSLMQVTIEEEGKTRVKDRFVVSAPVAGYVQRITLDVADNIKKQQVLTQLEPLRSAVLDPRSRANARASVAAAKSSLQASQEQALAAKADADYAEQEYQRKIQLKNTQFISDEALNLAIAEQRRTAAVLRSAHFAVDVARYNLEAASTQLQYSAAQSKGEPLKETVTIQSPVDGSVLFIHRESEGVVNAGDPLIEVGEPKALEIIVDVLSFDAVRIAPGMNVDIKHWGGEPLKARVRLIEPIGFTEVSALGVEEQRVWVVVDITSPSEQWTRLGDGYRIEATFYIWQQDNVVQVPNSSLFRYQNGWALYSVIDGRAERKQVTLGKRNGLTAQVVSGVEVGDQVITHPDNSIEPGVRVKE
jgi:HlyD family secretion protein